MGVTFSGNSMANLEKYDSNQRHIHKQPEDVVHLFSAAELRSVPFNEYALDAADPWLEKSTGEQGMFRSPAVSRSADDVIQLFSLSELENTHVSLAEVLGVDAQASRGDRLLGA